MSLSSFSVIFVLISVITCIASSLADLSVSKCTEALQRYPKPDVTYTAKHLWSPCPELCVNSSGHFSTGQFPHPWDCNAFINCYNDDAWIHWCQIGLQFNENNLECDYPKNVNCTQRSPPPSQKILVDPDTNSDQDREYVTTCKDNIPNLNEREDVGDRPDLCTDGTGNYRAPDCRFYVKCTGTRAYVTRCPAGFLFDPVNRQCDWPSANPSCLQSCQDKYDSVSPKPAASSPITTTIPKPLQVTTLSPAEQLDVANLTCNDSHCIPKAGCQPELCKSKIGHFAVPNECTKFANCWDSCAYVTDCPPSMVFTETRGMCEVPWNLPKDHSCYSLDGSDLQLTTNPTLS